MIFDFDTVIDRTDTGSEKWDRYAGRDIIPLWVADMDFRSPPTIIKALHRRIEHGVFGYTAPPATLIEAVLEMLRNEYDWQVLPEWLVWLPGLVSGINVACRAVGVDGDAIATFIPVYPPFLSAPALARRQLITVPLKSTDTGWGLDLDLLESAITDRTRLLMLCSPHNPVGRVWSMQELTAVAQLAERHNLVVCSDEIHSGLVLDQGKRHIPLASLSPDIARRTITLQAASKTYNIPGLGCSFAVIPDKELRSAFRATMNGIVPHINILGYTATEAAYRYGESWRQALLAYLRQNRDLVFEAVREVDGLLTWPVEATYLAWIDARGLGVDEPVGLFEKLGVGLSDGAPFGSPGFLRLNFGGPQTVLKQALARMKQVKK